jgi:hypothetical protein
VNHFAELLKKTIAESSEWNYHRMYRTDHGPHSKKLEDESSDPAQGVYDPALTQAIVQHFLRKVHAKK